MGEICSNILVTKIILMDQILYGEAADFWIVYKIVKFNYMPVTKDRSKTKGCKKN